jgi:hypothetical protein
MAYVTRKTVDMFQKLVEEGWEPRFDEIQEKFFPGEKTANKKATTLINRLRRRFKNETPAKYFYCVDKETDDNGETRLYSFRKNRGIYRVLESSSEYSQITDKLWRITNGFNTSCSRVLDDGVNRYPHTLGPLFTEFKAGLKLICNLAGGMNREISNAIKELNTGDINEPTNR